MSIQAAKRLVFGNWKMNGDQASIKQWFHQFDEISHNFSPRVGFGLAPSFVHIPLVQHLKPQNCMLGAQNVSVHEVAGAHTGDVNGAMLKDLGCDFVIIGHSEVRAQGETASARQTKVNIASNLGLLPVLCVGEPMAIREAGKSWPYVKKQLEELNGLQLTEIAIAYEPIWAIGSGIKASNDMIEDMHGHILNWFELHQEQLALKSLPKILYGGSVTSASASSLFALDGVHGALVGGASLKPAEFLSIVDAASSQISGE